MSEDDMRKLGFVPVWEFVRTPEGSFTYTHPAGEVIDELLAEAKENGDDDSAG